jgi:hypothetical protein
MSEPPYACELFVDFFCFEIIRIKVASDPVQHLVMRNLKDLMKLLQAHCARHQQAAPHGWFNAKQRDFDLIDPSVLSR